MTLAHNARLYEILFRDLLAAFPAEFGLRDGKPDPRYYFQFPDPANVQPANWVDQARNPNSVIQQFQQGDRAPLLKGRRYTSDSGSPSIYTYYGYWLHAVLPKNPLSGGPNSPLEKAIKAYEDPVYKSEYCYAPPGGQRYCFSAGTTYIGDATDNPVTDWASWSTGGALNLNPFTARIAAGEAAIATREPSVSKDLLSIPSITGTEEFLVFPGLKEDKRLNEDLRRDQDFVLYLDFGTVRPYSVSRPGWFDLNVLQTYKDHIYNSPIDFFNPIHGPLFLIPSRIFLGWNPVLTLRLGTGLYDKWKNRFDNKEGVVIAGIPVGVGMVPTLGGSPVPNTVDLIFGNPKSLPDMQRVPQIIGYVNDRIDSVRGPRRRAIKRLMRILGFPTAPDSTKISNSSPGHHIREWTQRILPRSSPPSWARIEGQEGGSSLSGGLLTAGAKSHTAWALSYADGAPRRAHRSPRKRF